MKAAPTRFIESKDAAPKALGFGWADSPFGDAFIAWDTMGIRYLSLTPRRGLGLVNELSAIWPLAELSESQTKAALLIEAVFQQTCTVPVVLQGTEFQCRVWRELANIPCGQVKTYSELAAKIGSPGAARAVGSALAANRVAYLIPCHRVVKKTGDAGEFRWGAGVKVDLLQWERCDQVAKY